MKLDEILSHTAKLSAPATLRDRVMTEVEKDRATRRDWTGRFPRYFGRQYYKPAAIATGALALVVLVISIWASHAPPPTEASRATPAQMAALAAKREMDLFLEDTVGTVYDFKSAENSAEYHVEEDPSRFIDDNLNRIFSINGGKNA